jgi:hypothetical protein
VPGGAGSQSTVTPAPVSPPTSLTRPNKAAGIKANDAIDQQCIRQVAPDLATKTQGPVTPEKETQLRAIKQAIGECVQKAMKAVMTPEERAQVEAQQRAEEALLQKCISQVAPNLASEPKGQASLTPEQAKQRMADKIKIGLCMGRLTPEQAAQMSAEQDRIQKCELQVAPELTTADPGPMPPDQEAQRRTAKQRVAACLGEVTSTQGDQGTKP